MPAQLSLRERKKQDRRQHIETVAMDLFTANGYENTTIASIAQAADISPRTFFSYFSIKEDVVLADYADRLNQLLTELHLRPSTEEPWEALRVSFVAVAADYENSRQQLIRRFSLIAANPSVFARSLQLQTEWENSLAAALSQRMELTTDDISPHLMAATALSVIRSSLFFWAQTGFTTPLPQLVEKCFSKLGQGLTQS